MGTHPCCCATAGATATTFSTSSSWGIRATGTPWGRASAYSREACRRFAKSPVEAVIFLKATRVESVEVSWPSGQKQTFRGLDVDKFYTIEEGRDQIGPQRFLRRAQTMKRDSQP